MAFDIKGTTAISGYDQIKVIGSATLGGVVSVSTPGFEPELDDTFVILDLPGGSTGTFAPIISPTYTIEGEDYTFVADYNGTNVTLRLELVSTDPPTIDEVDGVTPTSGGAGGGTTVTITGTNFLDATSVLFGGTPALSFTVDSATQITAVAPPHAAGVVDVEVWNSAGPSTVVDESDDNFTYTAGSAPTVTARGPTSGSTAGGTAVTVTGTGFSGATAVSFGSEPASSYFVISSTQILAYSPPSATTGAVHITVTTPSGTSSTSSSDEFTYTAVAVRSVTSLSPSTGSTAGGTSVTITGTGFDNATSVAFGGVTVSNFTINSSTSITVASPPHAAGVVDVTVSSSAGTSALVSGDRFTYTAAVPPTVDTLGPTSGTTAGGTNVIITGTGFTGATGVLFGGVPASNFVVNSDTRITAVSPAQTAPGTVNISVQTHGGTSSNTSADDFTYSAASAPTVTALSTSSGSTNGTTVVTITGTNLTGATEVKFGSVLAESFTVLSATSIVATAPAQAAGTVDVRVTTAGGTSSNTSADNFTYSAASAPTVTALSASAGTDTGGTAVTIAGSNFTGATEVKFGSVAAYFTLLTDNAILAYAPAQAAATVDVLVTTGGGTSSNTSADNFTYSAASAPSVTALSTSSGSTAGGTLLTVTGTGFADAWAVDFGGTTVYDFVVNSDTQITVFTPAHYAGVTDVRVTSAAGTSALASAGRFTYTLASAPAVSSLGTSSGSTAGGTSVTITGTDLGDTLAVYFGTVPAQGFTVNSSTSVTAIAPAQAAAGTVHVTVVTHAGTSAVSSNDQFTYSAASAPTVSSLATSSGTTAGGTLVGITGTNLTGATEVKFGSVAATFTVVSDTLITAWSPSQAAATVDVRVTTGGGTSSNTSDDNFVYSAASTPSVTGLSTTSGTTPGGTTVVLTGSGFTAATAVKFGTLDAVYFTVNSDTSITAVAPPSAAGSVYVRVTTAGGTSSTASANQYTYTNVSGSAPAVTAVSPNTGSTAGGRVVTLTGTGFTGATAVTFGSTAATSFTILSDTAIVATAPAGSAATIHITVTTNNGTSSTVSADQFTYLSTAAPSISSLSPSSGTTAGGTSVTITGTNFTSASAVSFGGFAAASFTVDSATQITATSPALPAGSFDVTVTTPSGVSAASTFTVSAASLPTVTSLGTSTGTTAGGTSVAITGTNFTGAIGVYFGGVAASFTVNSSTSITATSPAQYAGVYDVTVVTYAGTSALSSGDRFSYTAATAPAVSSLGTSSGTTAGGTTVVITGTNFTGATAVYFGSVAAASFTVDSATQITATSPVQAAGTVDVTVETYAGSSANTSSDNFTVSAASAPTVTSLGTSSGSTAGGTTVVITGTNFTGATSVTFGGVAASFVVDSATQITATSPSQAAGTVDVLVTTYGGTSSNTSSDNFTVSAASAPAVSGLTPSSGSVTGGTVVAITGGNFTGATGVTFGGTAAWFTVVSDTAILAYAPPGTAGTSDVLVTTDAGTSSNTSADNFTYSAASAPTVTGLSPATGGSGGGVSVTITGTNFLNATDVSFGGVAAAFTVVSATTIVATAPAMAAGTVDVVVTADGLTSALSSNSRYAVTAASAPAVTSLGTSSGSTAGGTSVTITGSNFTGATSVTFGTEAASFVVNSSTSITAWSPSQAASGTVDVIVTTPSGTSANTSSDNFTYSAASAPGVSALSLTGGGTAGGTVVTITGSNFTGATEVKFGTVTASFRVLDGGTIVATAPAQAAGTVDVSVTTGGGTSSNTSADNFTYSAASAPAITGLAANTGSVLGGTTVVVLGTNFKGATAVKFGSTDALSFTVLSDTALTAYAPPGTAGAVSVSVVTPSGTSSNVSADDYTYTALPSAPAVSSLDVSSGGSTGGTVVVITGTNFANVTGVKFGGLSAASFWVNSATQLTAVAPPQAAATVHITVTTASGTSSTSSSDQFTYSAVSPSVSAVTANAGPVAGGTVVTITGSNFTGATAVMFGSTPAAEFTVYSDTLIVARSPAQSAGTVHITVATPGGTSSTSSSDQFTYAAAPTVTGLSPNSGPTSGGTSVTITGTNFTGATAVYFGTTSASFTVNSSTQITATSPAHAAGIVYVTVTTPGGTSATSIWSSYSYPEGGGALVLAPSRGKEHRPRRPGGGNPGTAPALTQASLAPVVRQAVRMWVASGEPGAARLREDGYFTIEIGALPGAQLGLMADNVIALSRDAAGKGWFIDPTPGRNEEFGGPEGRGGEWLAHRGGPAAGRVDLLTVLLHELGHVLGLEHAHEHGLMEASLPAGVRRLAGDHPKHDDELRRAALTLAPEGSESLHHARGALGDTPPRPTRQESRPGRPPSMEKNDKQNNDALLETGLVSKVTAEGRQKHAADRVFAAWAEGPPGDALPWEGSGPYWDE